MQFLVKTTLITCLLVLGGIIYPFSALGYRVDDFRVNDSIPPSVLEQISVATDYKGKFVIGWEDHSDYLINHIAYFKIFRLDGSQVASQVRAPDVVEQGQKLLSSAGIPTMSPNGNVVLVRPMEKDSTDSQGNPVSFTRQYLDIFDSLGNPIVPTFLAETTALHLGGMRGDKEGNFTIVMERTLNDSLRETYFKQFYPDGQVRRSLTKVECGSLTGCDFEQQWQTISMNPEGKFIISWDAMHGQLPIAAIYNADGSPAGDPFILSCEDTTLNPPCVLPGVHCLSASAPKVGIDSSGNFMAAYNVCTDDPTGKHVYARLYDSFGNTLTLNMDIQEMEYTYFYTHRPRVVATEDGGYIVLWVDKSLEAPYKPGADIWAKRFNAAGEQIGIKYRINNSFGSVLSAAWMDAAVCNGHLFVAWYDRRGRPTLERSVYAQIMPVDEVGVFTPGDINYDFNVNLTDLIGMVNYVFKGADPPEGSPLVCDVNGNCKVDIADIIYLVNYLFKGGSPPIGCPI